MATPGRRTTRSMSRENTPGPVGVATDRAVVRGSTRTGPKTRPAVAVEQSFAYGSPGRAATPSLSTAATSQQSALAAIQAGVQTANVRPVGRDITTTQGQVTGGTTLPTIPEDHVSLGGASAGLSTAGVPTSAGQGKHIPDIEEGNSKGYGTEEPILGGPKSARSAKTLAAEKLKWKPRLPKTAMAPLPTAQPAQAHSYEPDVGLPDDEEQHLVQPGFAHRAWNFVKRHFRYVLWLIFQAIVLGFLSIVMYQLVYGFFDSRLEPFRRESPHRSIPGPTNSIMSYPITNHQYHTMMSRLGNIETAYANLQSEVISKTDRVNYFAPGLGAVIDPYLTSPTNTQTYKIRTWHRLGLGKYALPAPSAAEALTAWDDVGDCWCAPPAGGKTQLTVFLPHKISPTHLVVEHIPRLATLDIGAAPKDIEFWVQIPDPDKRDALYRATLGVVYDPENHDSDFAAPAPTKPPGMPDFGTKRALDQTWVRIGVWRYDVFGKHNVQTFAMQMDMTYFDVAVDKVSIRVKNNWGPSDYTCLYRLKLNGLLAEPKNEAQGNDEPANEV